MEPKRLSPEELKEIKADHRILHLLPSDRVVEHIAALDLEIAQLQTDLDAHRDANATAACSFCSWRQILYGSKEQRKAILIEHVRTCSAHPLRELERARDNLTAALTQSQEMTGMACRERDAALTHASRLEEVVRLANAELERLKPSGQCDCAAKNIACLHWMTAKPSGQAAEDVKAVEGDLTVDPDTWGVRGHAARSALSHLSAKAQGYEAAQEEVRVHIDRTLALERELHAKRDALGQIWAMVRGMSDPASIARSVIETFRAAVADNAVLLQGLRDLRARIEWVRENTERMAKQRELWSNETDVLRGCGSVDVVLAQPHPGTALLDAVSALLDLPYTIDESTIPASGPDAAPDQVVGTLHISLAKMRALRKALGSNSPTETEPRR